MTDVSSLSDITNQISDKSRQITQLLGELRPVNEQIMAGNYDPAILKKNNRIQEKIARLDESRDQLLKKLSR